ncbi:uncharacterized protein K444DRAFT_608387 [Hyaloscypha bicolor E]|uniref:Uncharacterized protein n=1 Tax=Hyaloscypha bicolor E TaxID=1095630 RepID=A0A2J6TNW3_9HELO|nr:uncharacterized protein K444DRAFT_608387 [Hyaloscypha bicolor E]PMD64702.1 hypothetical protein K444DRAFT_608387 [Hyaloscypha bicolor E]
MQLSTLLILVPAPLAAALPAPANDILSEIQGRKASPIAEAEPILYIKRTGYGDKREASPEAEAEAEPILYIKRTGYGDKHEIEG